MESHRCDTCEQTYEDLEMALVEINVEEKVYVEKNKGGNNCECYGCSQLRRAHVPITSQGRRASLNFTAQSAPAPMPPACLTQNPVIVPC